jgi:mono/diheme cytochrome c family protein
MKRTFLLLMLLPVIFLACRHADKHTNSLLKKSNLLTQFFTVNTNKDTVLLTANGALISIPAGALSNGGSSTAQLEIKEAYSMEQIIMAGLTTQSNGQPLSSGGMIYISAASGQSLKITKAIAVKIPTPSIDNKMQLFKGDTDANGNINWVRPDNLPANAQAEAFDNGKMLFMNNCAACHYIGKDGTGPDLAHINIRTPDKKLLYEYTRNNVAVMLHSNSEFPYYRCLLANRNKTAMNLFPDLTDKMLDDLYGYIENQSSIRHLPVPKDEVQPCIDSCETYRSLKYQLEEQKGKLSQEKIKMVVENVVAAIASADTVGPPVKVSPSNNESLYYQFNVEAFGWYNIDILLKDANAVESSLMIRLTGTFKQNINVYLLIPSAKVYEPGGLLDDKEDVYGFYKTDGSIWLPQNLRAYIIAFGEFEDKIIFSKKEFYTSTGLDAEMELSVVSKDFFKASMKDLNLSNIQFSVKDTKNADTLRKIIKELKDVEKIKPKNCDCSCLGTEPMALDTSVNLNPADIYILTSIPKK